MEKLVYFYPTGHQAHYASGHPERPERIEVIRRALERVDWWERFPKVEPAVLPDEVLQAVHSQDYLLRLKTACASGMHLDMDTYTTPASWKLAIDTAGGAAAAAFSVWCGEAQRGFALTRPPGHHATRDRGMGFCLLNNIAVAAQYLLTPREVDGLKASRLAIIDLDLHHGNGTQEIFWTRGDVFYMSLHQSPLYPGTGYLNERGSGAGEGLNANFPLPPGTGDEGFRAIFHSLVLPLLNQYQPEMLLVSFGFDTHWSDPLGSLNLSADGYGGLIRELTGWADRCCSGKIALFLEGGYDLQAGEACSLAAVSALLGEPWQDPLGISPNHEKPDWKETIRQAVKIWNLQGSHH